jgi:hypothetical protein
MSLLVNKHFYKDVYAIQDFFGSAAIGLVVSTFVVNAVYLDEDKYFTKTENAHRKNFIIMCCQAFAFFCLFIFKVVRAKVLSDNLKDRESEIQADEPIEASKVPKHPMRVWARIFQC